MAFIPEDRGFMGRLAGRVASAFQKPVDPKEAVRAWSSQIRAENRRTDRSIRGARGATRAPGVRARNWPPRAEIEMAEKKAQRQIKEYAKQNNMASAKVRCGRSRAC